MKIQEIALLFSILTCCGPAEDPEPHVTPVPGVEHCVDACANLATLGCVEGEPVPLPDGGSMPCSDFCVYEHQNGVYWNTDCLMTIKQCADVESCNVPPP